MDYTVYLSQKDLFYIIEKLHLYYYLQDIREVIYFLSLQVKTEEDDQNSSFDKAQDLPYDLAMAFTYKNTSEYPQMIPGVGHFQPGEQFTTDNKIDNKHFTLITEKLPQDAETKGDSPTVSKTV